MQYALMHWRRKGARNGSGLKLDLVWSQQRPEMHWPSGQRARLGDVSGVWLAESVLGGGCVQAQASQAQARGQGARSASNEVQDRARHLQGQETNKERNTAPLSFPVAVAASASSVCIT